jgi:hypothetical protein
MKTILRILLALAVPLAFSDQLNELRGRRDLSPYDMHKWLEFRALLPLPAYDQGDVATAPDYRSIQAPVALSDFGRANRQGA